MLDVTRGKVKLFKKLVVNCFKSCNMSRFETHSLRVTLAVSSIGYVPAKLEYSRKGILVRKTPI